MGVHAASASLVVSGEPAPGGDATELRRMTDELIMVGVDDLSVDMAGAGGGSAQCAALLTVLADVDSRMRAVGGRCRLTGVSTPALVDALAKAPLQDVFAIYTATRNRSGSPRSDRSRPDLGEPARRPRRRRAVAAPGDLATG